MRKVRIRTKKAPGFTRSVTILMRPERHQKLRVLAALRDASIQEVIDDLVGREPVGAGSPWEAEPMVSGNLRA